MLVVILGDLGFRGFLDILEAAFRIGFHQCLATGLLHCDRHLGRLVQPRFFGSLRHQTLIDQGLQ